MAQEVQQCKLTRREAMVFLAAIIALPTPTGRRLVVDIYADIAVIKAAGEELALLFKTRDIPEVVRERLLADLQEGFERPRISELCEFVSMPALRAGELRVQIQPGGLIKRAIATLRALPDKLDIDGHGGLPCVDLKSRNSKSTRGESLS